MLTDGMSEIELMCTSPCPYRKSRFARDTGPGLLPMVKLLDPCQPSTCAECLASLGEEKTQTELGK